MIDQIAAIIVHEGNWLPFAMSLALVAMAVTWHRASPDSSTRQRVLYAMNLFFATTIGVMAFGHLLAVTTKLLQGTLAGPIPLLYLIGVAIALPSWWLLRHTWGKWRAAQPVDRTTLGLNLWTAATLAVLGLHNLPLVVPGLLNIGYQLSSRRAVGWAIVTVAVVANVGLFVGSVIFMLSGQTFEEFQGI